MYLFYILDVCFICMTINISLNTNAVLISCTDGRYRENNWKAPHWSWWHRIWCRLAPGQGGSEKIRCIRKGMPSYCDLLLSRHLHSDIGNFSWQVFDPQYFAVSHAISCYLLKFVSKLLFCTGFLLICFYFNN